MSGLEEGKYGRRGLWHGESWMIGFLMNNYPLLIVLPILNQKNISIFSSNLLSITRTSYFLFILMS